MATRHPSQSRTGRRAAHGAGATLVELVIVIAVGAVVVSFMAMFIAGPVNAYGAQTRRAELVDDADSALRFMARDLRAALPNSVRISSSGGATTLELLSTVDGARYRDSGPLTDPTRELDLTSADGAFATTVPFSQVTLPYSSTSAYLVIYHVGVPGANAYDMTNVITPVGTQIRISAGSTANENLVTLSPAFKFAWGSPERRVFLVDTPVTYLCDPVAGTLTRWSGYSIGSVQLTSAAALATAGGTSARVALDVGACTFNYAAGTAQRAGLVTLSLALQRAGETVQLLHQVHLVNAP